MENGREIEGGRFCYPAVLRHCVYDCAAAREGKRDTGEKAACNLDAPRANGGGAGESQNSEGVARVGPSMAGVAIKYNFRGVGLIPRIPREYFIYYLHFVDT